ncbi:endolytic transglycosylase MltG [Sulfitobacter pseudonitzschiae]|uniref:Endolytic murein transglycosylase n=1 Tax=Pseudosulfitobacter pseudonitzschiae TaxID=1402135 RepID=A0A9Q2S1K6_9RHOB|nr:endolytic transglycosylase MltG [Pseudosulfitobacter pseudonitzschiae]MBM2292878.1 endolytic transglycosylase MltG [Pseudosulfitobacter pseudonitzschiae]MBM2298594.1 endolytic transglycosylase MltG [Pseudosulfitobacter pseudonitzschiae]MBM2303508.1 endolytic transglycosylase MltG [Pseudosulfitobacter pseudonitzschiae]MBM2313291.1 endolytic transglycosylase MltG [Pseudosulfitobacter pseudonitzschiae]MBM2318204.1 endolytic transglycosylase MltG [Pseudosulfitobacter pseudonitzschiae]
MWRHIASNALTFMLLAMFLLGGVILWGKAQYEAEGPLSDAICVEVPRGTNFDRVSRSLVDQGAVTSGPILRIGAKYAEKTEQLKAGSFLVEPGASMEQIVDVVTRGGASTCGTEVVYRIGVNRVSVQVRELDPATSKFVERAEFDQTVEDIPEIYTEVKAKPDTRFRVAVAEGVTSWQVTEGLRSMDVLEGEVPDVPAEGSLAPDSYEVRPGDDRAALLAQMEAAQEVLVAAAWEGRDEGLPVTTPEELLILASIIEKETGVPEERRQVASVFVNRLNQGMRLQTDPTVIYGITKGEGVLGRGLRQSELRGATPWNTYVIQGLPPTPIANPGRASLEAAARPDNTDFVFFVADGSGGHAFATTLEEHNRNVAEWRKIEAQQPTQDN